MKTQYKSLQRIVFVFVLSFVFLLNIAVPAFSAGKSCLYSDCNKSRKADSYYCYAHTCHHKDCNKKVVCDGKYCSSHTCSTSGCYQEVSYSSNKCAKHKDSDASSIKCNNSMSPSTAPTEKVVKNIDLAEDKVLNKLLNNYNAFADDDLIVVPDMVQKGIGRAITTVYFGDIRVGLNQTIDTNNNIIIDYYYEGNSDSELKKIFTFFCMAQDSSLSDEDIDTAWNTLKTSKAKYSLYTKYDLNGIKCEYWADPMKKGGYIYRVSTMYYDGNWD